MCISAGQNGARLIKMAGEEIGRQPCSKVILCHAQQDFDTMSSEDLMLRLNCHLRNPCQKILGDKGLKIVQGLMR